MLIKENKRKKVFSKKKDIDVYKFDLEPEYLGFDEFHGPDNTTTMTNQKVHKFNIKIPIDRLTAIKSDVTFIEAYLVRDTDVARSRKNMLSGFSGRKRSNLNFAIINKEILARNEMKEKETSALVYPIFSVGIVHSILLGLTKEKIKNMPEDEIFGFEEVIEPHKIVDSSMPNVNNLNIAHTNFNNNVRNDKSFKPASYQKYKKSLESTSKHAFRKEYIKSRAAGIDPAVLINSGRYNTQSLVDAIKGRIPENFSYKNQRQLIKNYSNIVESSISSNRKTVSIIKKKRSKRHQVFEKTIKITEETLDSFNNNISIIVYAKNKEKRKIDSYFLNYSFENLKNKRGLAEALDSYSKVDIRSIRKNNNVVFSLSNRSNLTVTFDIKRAVINDYAGIHNIVFENYNRKVLQPNTVSRGIKSKDRCLKNQALFYRSNFQIGGYKIDNTIFMHSSPIAHNSNNLSTVVGLTAKNNLSSIEILATNIPDTALGINVVKRNISKKEIPFNIIKTFGMTANNSIIDLHDHRPSFFDDYRDKNLEVRFVDNDVEESSVYEYKVISYMDNGEILESCNSLIHMFEKRRELVKIELVDRLNENLTSQIDSHQKAIVKYKFKVSVKKNAIMEMFESLDRNTYELLASELEDIKNSLTQNISCIVYLENIVNTSKKEIQRITPDKDGMIDVSLNLDNLFEKQNLIIEPRIKTSIDLIDNIIEKIEDLPTVDRNNLNTSFLKNLSAFKQKFKNKDGKNYISKIGEKYTSRSVRLLGTIIDPKTKFAKERDDIYFDGRTGDILKIRLPKANLSERKGILKFSNFIYSYDKPNNKINMLINMNSKYSEFIDFYSIYTLSNGSLSFKGLIAAEDDHNNNYSFYLGLKNETGLVEIYVSAVSKDGNIIMPTQLTSFIIEANKVRRI